MTDQPSFWILVVVSMVLGLIAQLGTSLAMEMTDNKNRFLGYLIMSMIFSGITTTLTLRLTDLDDFVCVAIGTSVGAIPPLMTLRMGVKMIGQKYNVTIAEMNTASPESPPTKPKAENDE